MDYAPRELAPNLWIFDRHLSVFGLRVGARMTAIQLDDGSLFLHSPIQPTAEARAALDREVQGGSAETGEFADQVLIAIRIVGETQSAENAQTRVGVLDIQ